MTKKQKNVTSTKLLYANEFEVEISWQQLENFVKPLLKAGVSIKLSEWSGDSYVTLILTTHARLLECVPPDLTEKEKN